MKKMTLDLDALVVETFDVEKDGGRLGTVVAHQPTYDADCTNADCGDSGYYYSCNGTACPSGCGVIYCNTYELCVNFTDQNTCANTCGGCGTAYTCATCPPCP
jgi:hypothetical protein